MRWEDFEDRMVAVRASRARLPELLRNRHAGRRRRPLTRHVGALALLEATAAVRGELTVGDAPRLLADRDQLLFRLASALERPDVDGIIATADIIDDLLMLDVLDEKIVVGVMNAGGPEGFAASSHDAFTGYDAQTIADSHLDGGYIDASIDPDDPGTGRFMADVGRAATALAANGVMALVEPVWRSGSAEATTDERIRAVQMVAGLGARSGYRWLLVPVTSDLDEVLRSTTLPVVLRYPADDADASAAVMREHVARPGVGGVVLSLPVLYSDADDPVAGVVRAIESVGEPRPGAEGR